ncbi:unnamed protein product [Phaeothamnion confervicola]
MKIIDKMRDAEKDRHIFYSFEFFPPKTAAGVENLHPRMERMASLEPLFVDVTWGAGGSTSELTLAISASAQRYLGVEVLMHLTCTGLTVPEIKNALQQARDAGIQNILALRGDPAKGAASWEATEGGLQHAVDLVRLIRREYGDFFGVAVAGLPEGHPDSRSREEELRHLKEKVEAGADFIVTQFFYDTVVYADYVRDCRAVGIICPIVPGIMAIQNYTAFTRMTEFCKTRVPPALAAALEPVKDDDEAVKQRGVELGIDMCKELVAGGAPAGLHFYTLNLERSVRLILTGAGYTERAAERRQYPWRASTLARRANEDVRPINWANRPRSYLARTEVWDEFPNGRWGDGRSPAFGELSDSHFYRFSSGTREDRKAMWGEAPISVEDVSPVHETFVRYIEGRIPKLPWCEVALQAESGAIRTALADVNRAGFLTINSQPAVNGARSDHPVFGWGGKGGRVYQKAYVEFFASPKVDGKVLEACAQRPQLNYFAADAKGNTYSSGIRGTTAVTWGVFPDKEVLQPTIFDPETFMVWKEEAFRLWIELWASLYDDETKSSALLHAVHDAYFLVAIIDNDYVAGGLWDIFEEIVAKDRTPMGPAPMHAA